MSLINLIEEGKKTRLREAGEDRRARSGMYRVGPLRSGRRDSEDTESEERVGSSGSSPRFVDRTSQVHLIVSCVDILRLFSSLKVLVC